jgi:hypothetical protein
MHFFWIEIDHSLKFAYAAGIFRCEEDLEISALRLVCCVSSLFCDILLFLKRKDARKEDIGIIFDIKNGYRQKQCYNQDYPIRLYLFHQFFHTPTK